MKAKERAVQLVRNLKLTSQSLISLKSKEKWVACLNNHLKLLIVHIKNLLFLRIRMYKALAGIALLINQITIN
jgi:hypothetical protein